MRESRPSDLASTGSGIGLLAIGGSQSLAFVAALLIGLELGAEVDITAFLTGRYFGLHSFGAIYGFIFSGFGLAAGLGPYLMDATFDTTGSYASALALFCLITFAGAAIMMFLGPYRFEKALTLQKHASATAASM